MNFNAIKCKIMSVARTVKYNMFYCLDGTILDRVSEFNDLGVIVTSTMSWSAHIRSKVSKANQLLGMIKRALGIHAPSRAKQLLYSAVVKTTVLYGSVFWSANKHELNMIESIQRRATKYILNNSSSEYKLRLRLLNMLPLCYCKEMADICFIYKCIHNFYAIDIRNLLNFHVSTRTTRSSYRYQLLIPRVMHTEKFAQFYTNRIVPIWNSLPDAVKSTPSRNKFIRPFKRVLHVYYTSMLTTRFDVDDACTWTSCCRCARCRST